MDEVLEFIDRRFGDTDSHWTDGNCYYFAVILCARFQYLQIYYAPVSGHFVAGAQNRYFDAHGEYTDETPILFAEIEQTDPLWAQRLVKYCIL